jgi:hypothetical protein
MDDAALRTELERIYTRMRDGFATYDLDAIRASVDIPEDEPLPNRGQAQQIAAFFPDLSQGEFLKIEREGDRLGYYCLHREEDGTACVTVIRYREEEGGCKLVPGAHTLSSYSSDEGTPEEWLRSQECLRVVPEGDDEPAPSAPPAPPSPDLRPEAEIRADLEAVWAGIRGAFERGKPEDALPFLAVDDPSELPPAEDAKKVLTGLPDFAEAEFLKLGFHPAKPDVVAYFASTNLDAPDRSTIDLVVFTHRDGKWVYAPGPGTMEQKTIPEKTDRAGLLRILETDPSLGF